MQAKDYIISKLSKLVQLVPQLMLRYENDTDNNSHTIEVTPSSFYKENIDFQSFEENIIFDFIDAFPNQNISFIPVGYEYGINSVDFEICGSEFLVKEMSNTIFTFSSTINKVITSINFNKLFDKYTPLFNQQYHIKEIEALIFPSLIETNFKEVINVTVKEREKEKTEINSDDFSQINSDPNYFPSGENNYALAA